jgi:spore coat polysaccharide biosynthesis protein SpsF
VNPLVIVQARTNSSRLPGKALLLINSEPVICRQLKRIMKAEIPVKIILATSREESDDKLVQLVDELEIEVFRGDLVDVHSRYLEIILKNPEFDPIVRLTGDCPLIMPEVLDSMLTHFSFSQVDYLSNSITPTYPDGLDVEIFSRTAFLRMSGLNLTEQQREHVTLKFYEETSGFVIENFKNREDLSAMRWTLDYEEDFNFIRDVYEEFKGKEDEFNFDDVLTLLKNKPHILNKLPGSFRNIALRKDG